MPPYRTNSYKEAIFIKKFDYYSNKEILDSTVPKIGQPFEYNIGTGWENFRFFSIFQKRGLIQVRLPSYFMTNEDWYYYDEESRQI